MAPPGCAIGLSGPTLDPGDAVRNARVDALTQLAAVGEETVVRVDSELLVATGGRGGEFTRQDVSGALRDARIVAMWAERASATDGRSRERHVYALACERSAEAASLVDPTVPAWILNLPDDPARACALGVGGPTRDPRDQPQAALRDARRALAASLESELGQILIDTGRYPRIASELQATARALARAEGVSEIDEVWSDMRGTGPLGLEQTLYGLICVPR